MELKKSWQEAWELGREYSEKCGSIREAYVNLYWYDHPEMAEPSDTWDDFFEAGFRGHEPEWVEAIRYGDIPERGFSINWADHSPEPGVSVVKIIREPGDEIDNSIYSITLQNRKLIRVAGWWLGNTGSDGEACLRGCVKVS